MDHFYLNGSFHEYDKILYHLGELELLLFVIVLQHLDIYTHPSTLLSIEQSLHSSLIQLQLLLPKRPIFYEFVATLK